MRLHRILPALGLLGALLVPGVATAQPAVDGTTYVVDTTADGPVDDPTGCDAPGGDTCTLREAILEANRNAPGTTDLIVFDATVFPPTGATTIALTEGGPGELGPDATTGDLDIVGSVVIHGPGVVVDPSGIEGGPTFDQEGPAGDRAFDVFGSGDVMYNRRGTLPADPVVVTIEGLTVRGGTSWSEDGGAIRVTGSCPDPSAVDLTLRDVVLEDNVVFSDFGLGGGLAAFGADVTVEDSTIRDNAAVRGGGLASSACGELVVRRSTVTSNDTLLRMARQRVITAGAGIWSSSGLTIDRSVISDNGTAEGGTPEQGGGIHVSEPDATGPVPLRITGSVVEGNRAHHRGGGLWVGNRSYDNPASGDLVEATSFVDNQSEEGGAIFSQDSYGLVNNSTIVGNRAFVGAGVMVVEGDGTTTSAGSSTVDLLHTTVEDNQQPDVTPEYAGVTSQPASLQVRDHGGFAVIGFFNSILQSSASPDPTCLGTSTVSFASLGGNSDDDGTCELVADSDAPSTLQDLGALGPNGGPLAGDDSSTAVVTMALQRGSEGIDAGTDTVSSPTFAQTPFVSCGQPGGAGETDQRGVPRPQDGDNDGTAVCDRGAFELEPRTGPTPTPSTVDVAVDKTGPDTVLLGEDVVFTLTVTNARNTATGVVVADTIPAGLSLVDASAPCTIAGDTVMCDLGTLSGGGSEAVTITTTAEAEGTITNTACASTTGNDTDAANDCDDHTVVVMQETERVEGPERITTAVAGSQVAFEDGEADAVVLTRSDDFPDAQAGTALAIARNASLLLTQPDALALASEDELLRVMSPGGTVYLLGGTAALGQAVEDRVVELGYVVVRLAGSNRFGTATAIAAELGDPGTLLLADGGDFPHSVVAGAAAVVAGDSDFSQTGNVGAAVLLTDGASVPPETQAYLDGRGDTPEIVPIGSPAADAFPEEEDAIVGGDAYEVSANVAAAFFDGPSAIGVATGANFADALTGGSVVGRPDVGPGPILLTAPDALPGSVADYITAVGDGVGRVLVFGGTAAIEASVEEAIQDILAR